MATLQREYDIKRHVASSKVVRNNVLQAAHLDGVMLVEIPTSTFKLLDRLERSKTPVFDTRDYDSLHDNLHVKMHKWEGVFPMRTAPKQKGISKKQHEYDTQDFLKWQKQHDNYTDFIHYLLKVRAILDIFEAEFMCYDRIPEKAADPPRRTRVSGSSALAAAVAVPVGAAGSPAKVGKNKNIQTNIAVDMLESRFLTANRKERAITTPMVIAMQMVRRKGEAADELRPVAFLSYTIYDTFGVRAEDNPIITEFKQKMIKDKSVQADALALEINLICKQKEEKFGVSPTKNVVGYLLAYAIANSQCTKHHPSVVFVEATPLKGKPNKYPAEKVCELLGVGKQFYASKKLRIAEKILYSVGPSAMVNNVFAYLNASTMVTDGDDIERLCWPKGVPRGCL